MAALYVIVSCFLLIYFRWRQEIQGRMYPFICLSCMYGIWMVINGSFPPIDGATIALLSLCVWMLASTMWTEKQSALLEILLWFSYFVLFMAARSLPFEIVAWILVINPSIFAALQLYAQKKLPTTGKQHLLYPVFGNSNHNSAFLLVGFYASLWIGLNGTPLVLLFSLLIGVAISASSCRAGVFALVTSLILALAIIRTEILLYIVLIELSFVCSSIPRIYDRFNTFGTSGRIGIYKNAVMKIYPKFITGRGMNFFRDTDYGRVHNDHIEIVGEVGFVGYFLFLNIFFQLGLDPLILCAVVAFFIDGMFFYPLREVHAAAPFWVMAGSAGNSLDGSFYTMKLAAAFSIIMVFLFSFKVLCNVLEWERAQREGK